jgi:hypothetical protein
MSNGSVARLPKDLLTPSMPVVTLKYHTVPRDRLLELTVRDLSSCGIPARSLGRVSGAFRVTLVGCVVVNEHARSYLPTALGGSADDLDVSADTSRLSEASFARSPAARLRATAPPPADAPGTPPRPTPPSPSRSALLRAASDAVDAADAADGDLLGRWTLQRGSESRNLQIGRGRGSD